MFLYHIGNTHGLSLIFRLFVSLSFRHMFDNCLFVLYYFIPFMISLLRVFRVTLQIHFCYSFFLVFSLCVWILFVVFLFDVCHCHVVGMLGLILSCL